METRTEFIFYAMSNASQSLFPNNKSHDFKIHLPQPLKLDGEWEVGISSAIYPYTWETVHSCKMEFAYMLERNGEAFEHTKLAQYRTLFISSQFTLDIGNQFFNTIEELLNELNYKINTAIHEVAQNSNSNSVKEKAYIELELTKELPHRIQVKKGGHKMIIVLRLPEVSTPDRDLWQKLGIDDSVTELIKLGNNSSHDIMLRDRKANVIGKNPASITKHMPALYVYSPLIQYVGVGDTMAPLLGLLPIKGKPGDIIYERFDRPIYNRLALNLVSDIEIGIKDDQGSDVKFLLGKTIFALNFRRRS